MSPKKAKELPAGALLKVNFRGYGESEDHYYVVTENNQLVISVLPLFVGVPRPSRVTLINMTATFLFDFESELIIGAKRVA